MQVQPSENERPVFVFFQFVKITLLPESLLVLTENPSWVKVDLVCILPVPLRKGHFGKL